MEGGGLHFKDSDWEFRLLLNSLEGEGFVLRLRTEDCKLRIQDLGFGVQDLSTWRLPTTLQSLDSKALEHKAKHLPIKS